MNDVFKFYFDLNNNVGIALIILPIIIQIILLPIIIFCQSKKNSFDFIFLRLEKKIKLLKKKYKGGELNYKIYKLFKSNNSNYLYKDIHIILFAIQIPILLLFYFFFISNIELFNKSFLFFDNLSLPDNFFSFKLLKEENINLNILPISLLIIFLIKTFNSIDKNIFSLLFSIFFIFLIFNYPSGLFIFWISFLLSKYFFEFLTSRFL